MYSVEKFANSKKLPTLPEVAMRLVELAQQEEPSFKEISRVVKSDPVISGKLLKTVNSALFGLRTRVDTVEQAIPILGLTLLRTLILSFHLARHKQAEELSSAFKNLWRCSLSQAVFAELIAEKVAILDPPSCFLAAMLQDIGALAMLSEAPKAYISAVLGSASFPNVAAAERCHFGFSHVDVSLEIVKNWGMGDEFSEAIRHHHDEITAPLQGRKLRSVLQAANLGTTFLLTKRSATHRLNEGLARWTQFLYDHFGLSEEKADAILSEVNERVGDYSILFSFDIDESVEVDEVVAVAKDLLQELALNSQLKQVEQRKKKRSGASDELYLDSLTGLYNRRFVNECLNERIARSVKHKSPLALYFLDIDKFKSINDGHGHTAGDQAICHVAKWLKGFMKQNCQAIRLGGDEFLVILEVADEAAFEAVSLRLVDLPPMESSGRPIKVTMSVGATFYQPHAGDIADANWLVDQSDQLMYLAKHAGGATVCMKTYDGMDSCSDPQIPMLTD